MMKTWQSFISQIYDLLWIFSQSTNAIQTTLSAGLCESGYLVIHGIMMTNMFSKQEKEDDALVYVVTILL